MKKIYFFIGALFLAGGASAQAPFITNSYQFLPTIKHAPGAISTVDGREISGEMDRTTYYSENFDMDFGGWTAEIQTGPVGFALTATGHENDPENTFQIPVLNTDTPTQWVLVDSDGLNSSYGTAEEATLTSPELDLSASIGEYVAFTFDQFFAEWQPAETEDHCYIGVSVDGLTWVEKEINEGVGREARPNPEKVSWDISDLIAGSESSVWLRFRWEGAWNYGWQIDNVEIENINASDISVMDAYRTYDGGIVYSQVAEAHASEFIIGAIIRNTGHFDQTNIAFDYTITGPGGAEVASGTSADVIPLLTNGEQDTLLHATGFVPTELGSYTIEWVATSDDTDDAPADNTVEDDHFMLTEYTMALDYNEGSIVEIDNWPLKVGEAYFGNLMTFQTTDVATALEVKLTNHSVNEGEIIRAAVWAFPEGGAEWYDAYQGDDYIITEDDLGEIISLSLDGFNVDDANTYLFTVYQYNSAPMPLFEKQGDIGFNNIQGKDDELLNRGFFDRKAPIVRARLYADEVSVNENKSEDKFGMYPNPANDNLNVVLSLNESENTNLNIVSISGQIIKTVSLGSLNGTKTVQISLDELTTGIYFVELINKNGKQVKKFIKQ
jgi:hypothetical protein